MIQKLANNLFDRFFQKKDIPAEKPDLIIIDDIFPHLLSGFRIAEFNYYLKHINNVKIYSSTSAFKWLPGYTNFSHAFKEYNKVYPGNIKKINLLVDQPLNAKLIYLVFLHNTYEYLSKIESYKIPFVFTLYPGGGFQLRQDHSDKMLIAVFLSSYFRKVIVTSKVTYNYLLDNNFCTADKIEFIYGVVTQSNVFEKQNIQKKRFRDEKDTFDICFVAHKYTLEGKDKGYDVFINVAKELVKLHINIHFHVVGNFDENDIDISAIKENVLFYNTLKTHDFAEFYSTMDIIISANSSFIISPGGFDGFPTGGCVEAGMNSVALFVSDDQNQNVAFTDNENIVVVSRDIDFIVEKVLYFYNNVHELYELAEKGRKVIYTHYNLEAQMSPRLKLLTHFINK